MSKNVTWIKSGITGPNVMLHGYDHFGRNIYVPRCFIYEKRLDENLIRKALEEMMPSFSLLTGRIIKDNNGYLVVDQNDKGIRFEVKQSKKDYKQYSAEDNFSKQCQSHVFHRLTIVNKDAPIVTVTITHFKDHGSVFGYSNIHSILDGNSNSNFLMSLSNQIMGIENQPFHFDRGGLEFPEFDFHQLNENKAVVLLSKRAMAKMYFNFIYGFLFGNKAKTIKFEASVMAKLKAYGLSQGEATVSKMDIFAAIIWKCVATIRKDKKVPLFNYTVNLRFKTSIDTNYLGNTATGWHIYDGPELIDKPIIEIARKIRASLAELNDEYAAREAQFLNKLVKEKRIGQAVQKELVEINNQGAIMFNSTFKYPFYSLDFGTGKPTWYDMPPGPLNGIFTPMPDADGQSINLGMGISKKEFEPFLKLFREELSKIN